MKIYTVLVAVEYNIQEIIAQSELPYFILIYISKHTEDKLHRIFQIQGHWDSDIKSLQKRKFSGPCLTHTKS